MDFITLPLLVLSALVLDAVVGYPDAVYRRIGHPVTWMGWLIARFDRDFNNDDADPQSRRWAGIWSLCLLIAAVLSAAYLFDVVVSLNAVVGAILTIALMSSLLAQKSLHDHVADVARALREEGLEAGRRSVSMIVGRNTSVLDEAGVCRAAVESLAENFSDGVVAPAFWMAVGGIEGGTAYKAINTADSMIGHKTPRHRSFGWAAARLDDLVNLPASRLAAAALVAAALVTRGAQPGGALRAVMRDAGRHRSPNAGWPEAAMAGALGFALAGPRVYGNVRVEDFYMGDGRTELTPDDVDRALTLYRRACGALWTAMLVAALIAV